MLEPAPVPEEAIRLTRFSHGAGCACKLSPAELRTVLGLVRGLDPPADPNLLVGLDTADDAAVYRVRDDLAIVFTADFFTPIVDDPYDFGRVAATNALSDIYAMGARPVMCLNLVAWPREGLPFELLARTIDGGAAVARSAGALVVGGHSIDDTEPKYGMAVVGTVDPRHVLTNGGARPGDAYPHLDDVEERGWREVRANERAEVRRPDLRRGHRARLLSVTRSSKSVELGRSINSTVHSIP